MKFNEIAREEWNGLQPYLDTCLIPITGLDGSEAPWQATDKLSRLGDALAAIELPFKGRVVTYPAVHYTVGDSWRETVRLLCANAKKSGFVYCLVVSADRTVPEPIEGCDLWLSGADAERLGSGDWKELVATRIGAMWHNGKTT